MMKQHLFQMPVDDSENCAECGRGLTDPVHISIPGPSASKPSTSTPEMSAWDCAIGTPDEDHDWHYDGGDSTVGIEGAWICRACGKVDESDREPPSDDYEERYL